MQSGEFHLGENCYIIGVCRGMDLIFALREVTEPVDTGVSKPWKMALQVLAYRLGTPEWTYT